MCFLFVFMGIFGGYSAARLYKMFKLAHWKSNTLHTVRQCASRSDRKQYAIQSRETCTSK
jgi:hypothetical protein